MFTNKVESEITIVTTNNQRGVNGMRLNNQLIRNGEKVKMRKENMELLKRVMTEVAKVEILTRYMDKCCLIMNLEFTVSGLLYEYETFEDFLNDEEIEVDRMDEIMKKAVKESL